MESSKPVGLVCATSRRDSTSMKVLRCYEQILQQRHGVLTEVFDLAQLPADFLTAVLYQSSRSSHPQWQVWQQKLDYLEHFVFVIPEYNGSYPGILKAFVDAMAYPRSLQGKKTSMVGLSDGTQGAALAMAHFADVLNYAGALTLPLRPRLIQINRYMEGENLVHEPYQRLLEQHADAFIALGRPF
ncbi:MAG: NADPH-dependent FMN reductase [Bacteroidota bacterium]